MRNSMCDTFMFCLIFFETMCGESRYVGLLLGFSFAHFLKWFNLAFEQTLRTWELNKAIREQVCIYVRIYGVKFSNFFFAGERRRGSKKEGKEGRRGRAGRGGRERRQSVILLLHIPQSQDEFKMRT